MKTAIEKAEYWLNDNVAGWTQTQLQTLTTLLEEQDRDPLVLLFASDVREKFFWYVRSNYRTHKEAASHYKVSPAFISAVARGNRGPNEAMLKDMGLKEISGYRVVSPPIKVLRRRNL